MAKEEDEIVQQEQQSPESPGPERIVINPDADPDDDDDGESGAAAQVAGDKPSRRGGYKALKESTRKERERGDRLEREIAELRGRASAPQAPIVIRNDQPAVDPVDAELEAIESQKSGLLASIRASSDPAEVAKLTKQWNAADAKRIKVMTSAAVRAERAAQPRDDLDQRVGQQTLETNYPRIFSGPNATAYKLQAQAEAALIEESGRGVSSGRSALSVAQEAAQIIYARHGLGGQKPAAPTATDRARHIAAPTRPAATGREGWSPNKQQLINALAYTDHRRGPNGQALTDQQRVQIWYNEVGKKAGVV